LKKKRAKQRTRRRPACPDG